MGAGELSGAVMGVGEGGGGGGRWEIVGDRVRRAALCPRGPPALDQPSSSPSCLPPRKRVARGARCRGLGAAVSRPPPRRARAPCGARARRGPGVREAPERGAVGREESQKGAGGVVRWRAAPCARRRGVGGAGARRVAGRPRGRPARAARARGWGGALGRSAKHKRGGWGGKGESVPWLIGRAGDRAAPGGSPRRRPAGQPPPRPCRV